MDDVKHGSIVYIIGREKVYGIRATLHLPDNYFVYDTLGLAEVIVRDRQPASSSHVDGKKDAGEKSLAGEVLTDVFPNVAQAAQSVSFVASSVKTSITSAVALASVSKAEIEEAVKYNYFDVYFALCAEPTGENARVEAGIFKYSGPQSNSWKAFRVGLNRPIDSNFHGEVFDESFTKTQHLMQLGFKPGNKDVIELMINNNVIAGPMTLNDKIEPRTYENGGLYPKAAIGICNFGGKIRFSKLTLDHIQVNHDKELKSAAWKPFTQYGKYNKFTHGDNIGSNLTPFAAWSPSR